MTVVAISDLHGHKPAVPACDLLVVSGDICFDRVGPYWARHAPDQQLHHFKRDILPYLRAQPAKHIVLTWGNHDYCGELQPTPVVQYDDHIYALVDGEVTIEGKRVWGTPWTPPFMQWALMKPEDALAEVYTAMPKGLDILVSHGPPYGVGDQNILGEHCGGRALRNAVLSKQPRVVVCGHIHGGRGIYNLGDTTVYNASVVDEAYRLVHEPMEFIV